MIAAAFAWVLAKLAGFAGGKVFDKLLGFLNDQARTENERLKIEAAREEAANATAASVVKAGMQHRVFWIAWGIAALPTSTWYGWGIADSLFNGGLPDVAELPPQLKLYADVVFANIFYAGAGVSAALGSASIIAGALRGRK